MDGKIDEIREALEEFVKWSEAYPVDVFHEPTPEQVDAVCKTLGFRIDAISAMVLRNFTKHFGDIAKQALSALSAIDSEAKIKRIEELETELESARKDRRIAWDDANKAEAALSTIDPEAIRRECARDARNAIFDFGIGNKASNYYSPTIRRDLAVQLVERAILSAEPAQDDEEPEDESLQETLDRMDGYGIDNECGARG